MQPRTVMVPVQMLLRSPSPQHRQMLGPAGSAYGRQGLSFHAPLVDRRVEAARPSHCAAWAQEHPRRREDEEPPSAKATPRLVHRVLAHDLPVPVKSQERQGERKEVEAGPTWASK